MANTSPNNECACGAVHATCPNKRREVDEDGNVSVYCCDGVLVGRE